MHSSREMDGETDNLLLVQENSHIIFIVVGHDVWKLEHSPLCSAVITIPDKSDS